MINSQFSKSIKQKFCLSKIYNVEVKTPKSVIALTSTFMLYEPFTCEMFPAFYNFLYIYSAVVFSFHLTK